MANPNRDRIVDHLITTLSGIVAGQPRLPPSSGNFPLTVRKVEHRGKVSIELPADHMPWIGITEGDENHTPTQMADYQNFYRLNLNLVVRAGDEPSSRQLLNDLWDEVFAQIHADQRRGLSGGAGSDPNAYETRAISTSEIDMLSDQVARLTMVIECRYVRRSFIP